MKKGIHPESYRLVAFKDMSNEHTFLTRSSAASKEKLKLMALSIRLLRWKFQILHTRFIPVK